MDADVPGIKRLGNDGGKHHHRDIYSEWGIELDGLTELTRIDPSRLVNFLKTDPGEYGELKKAALKGVLEYGRRYHSKELIDNMVDVRIAIDIIKKFVFEAGSYEKAISHISDRYGISPLEIVVDLRSDRLEVVELVRKFDIKEASRVITCFYGPKIAEEVFSIFMISRAGRLVGVKNSSGKIVGVIQVLYDRWADTYIHAYCVLKNYRGAGVGLMLLDAVEEASGGGRVWATRAPDMVHNIRNLLDKGYVGTAYIPDYWGGGKPRIVFERVSGGRMWSGAGEDIPLLDAPDYGSEVFCVGIRDGLVLEDALNRRNYRIVGFREDKAMPQDCASCKVVLERSDEKSVFLERDYAMSLSFEGGRFSIAQVSAFEGVEEVIRFGDEINMDPREDYGTYKMLTYVGGLFGVRDGIRGPLVISFGLLWDNKGGIFVHALNIRPGFEGRELLKPVFDCVGRLCLDEGRWIIRLIHSIDDIALLKVFINDLGFSSVEEHLNPYDNGRNYLSLEKNAGEGLRSPIPDLAGLEIVKGMHELNDDSRTIASYVRSYSLTHELLNAGYRIVSVLDDSETGMPLFVLTKGF
jgi:GNAT superfamily N-acetyltransferase